MARFLLGAFGDAGHVFPCMALGVELRARGHEVAIHTAVRWKQEVEREGLTFFAAPEYSLDQTGGVPLKPYEAVATASAQAETAIREFDADLVVADILTLAPALGAEMAGVPVATLIPHVFPEIRGGWPPYSLGARLPRTPLGTAMWNVLTPKLDRGLLKGMRECNETRARVGLRPRMWVHNGQSPELVLVATLPQFEYPRTWAEHIHVVGPLFWQPPAEPTHMPSSDRPLVLVAPSTAKDPGHQLLRASVTGLADAPVRVIASWNRPGPHPHLDVPENTTIVEWLSYSDTMPHADLVISHAGHGTLMRALSNACRVVAVPVGGDMNENAARVEWARVGVRVPRRAATSAVIRLACERALAHRAIGERVAEIAQWCTANPGQAHAADLCERHIGIRS